MCVADLDIRDLQKCVWSKGVQLVRYSMYVVELEVTE